MDVTRLSKEEFKLHVVGQVLISSIDKLQEIVVGLEPGAEFTNLSRLDLIRKIHTEIENESKKEDEGISTLLQLNDKFKSVMSDSTSSDELEEQEKVITTGSSETVEKKLDISFTEKCSVFRKDFKISDQTGEGKGCISYGSLVRQIEAGIEKGFT